MTKASVPGASLVDLLAKVKCSLWGAEGDKEQYHVKPERELSLEDAAL